MDTSSFLFGLRASVYNVCRRTSLVKASSEIARPLLICGSGTCRSSPGRLSFRKVETAVRSFVAPWVTWTAGALSVSYIYYVSLSIRPATIVSQHESHPGDQTS